MKTDDAIGGQDARGGKAVAGHGGALDIVNGFDQIINPKGDGCHQQHSKNWKPEKHVQRPERHAKAEVGEGTGQARQTHSAIIEAQRGGTPGNHAADGDGDQTRRYATVFHATEPA